MQNKKVCYKVENNEFKKSWYSKSYEYYLSDIIELEDFDLDNILIDENSPENMLIHDISYKTLIDPKPLRIGFDKIDGIIMIYDGTGKI